VRAEVTADGCSVRVYELLPDVDLPIEFAVLSSGQSVLDLGAGTGRFCRPLMRRGCRLTAVDNSVEMLASIAGTETVCADIEQLRLPERFDAVLLASHLVNTQEAPQRRSFLETAAYHLVPDGIAFIEWHPPTWFDRLSPGLVTTSQIGPVTVELEVHAIEKADWVDATVTYRHTGDEWLQHFCAARLSQGDLIEELAAVGLQLVTASQDASWQLARRN